MNTLPVEVAILAKAPVAGLAKTRLIPALGAVGAARLHRRLVLRTLAVVLDAGMVPTLWCAPSPAHRFFRALQASTSVDCKTQAEGDIGQRMHAVFEQHAQRSLAPLLLIGSDCPVFSASHLRQAAQRLLGGDEAVVTPAEDGGYVLIGLKQPQATLFEGLAWSTSEVMAQTRQRLRAAGLRYSEMPTLWDVDTPQDLVRWQALAAGQA
jgi:rSAM/selenodomain-associated transferase 1